MLRRCRTVMCPGAWRTTVHRPLCAVSYWWQIRRLQAVDLRMQRRELHERNLSRGYDKKALVDLGPRNFLEEAREIGSTIQRRRIRGRGNRALARQRPVVLRPEPLGAALQSPPLRELDAEQAECD